MDLKIATFNVQHFSEFYSGRIDLPLFAKTIRESGADIVGLNETYGAGSSYGKLTQVEELAEMLGMHRYFSEATALASGRYGNSILSRYPLEDCRTVPIPDPEVRRYDGYYETRAVLRCIADVNGAKLDLAVTHFGLNPDEHENAVKTVLSQIGDERFVLMGDLNVTPENAVLDPIRRRLRDTADAGGKAMLTFPADAPDRKIDYIFVSADMKTVAAEVLPAVVSDHRAYLATFEL